MRAEEGSNQFWLHPIPLTPAYHTAPAQCPSAPRSVYASVNREMPVHRSVQFVVRLTSVPLHAPQTSSDDEQQNNDS